MKKKNFAIVGYGGMGHWHGEFAAYKNDTVNLKGIYDIKNERCELAKTENKLVYDSLEAVLNDPDIEIVTVATPNDKHEEICIKCLEAGKNVICEKPVTMSLESLDRMIAAAEKNGKIFSVHQNRRWDEDYLAIKGLKESGEIGEFFTVESRVHGSRGVPGDWRKEKRFGGGMILDWGVHLIDQMLQIFDEKIDTVYCRCDNITTTEVDDGFMLIINFEGGKRAVIEVGTYNFLNLPRWYLKAEQGSAKITTWGSDCEVVKVKYFTNNDAIPVKTAAGLTKTMAPRDESTTENYAVKLPIADVHDYYRNFCKAIDGEETQIVTHKEMRRVMKVMEAAFESHETKQAVKFAEEE